MKEQNMDDHSYGRWIGYEYFTRPSVSVKIRAGKWYTWEAIRRHGYDSLLWGPDIDPMPVVRFTVRELLLIGRWK